MIGKAIRFLKSVRSRQQLILSMARAGSVAPLRSLDPASPQTWEFRGFSQHGEDGILDYLTRQLIAPSRSFVEIGIGDGTENNSTWFVLAHYYRGLMIDGSAKGVMWARHLLQSGNFGVRFDHVFVTVEDIWKVLRLIEPEDNPDFFSLDIDGNDYWIAQAILKAGLRPKIWVVEYNSAYGPKRCVSIPYNRTFAARQGRGVSLYYGCSIAAWRHLMESRGYRFVTVESCGCNAFFADAQAFSEEFLAGIQGTEFRENSSHLREYGPGWTQHMKLLDGYDIVEV